jgi:hypothetical protein
MTDDPFEELLRAALPPTEDTAVRRDAWPALVDRLSERPRWSLIDAGLGVAAASALLMFPEWVVPLVYHL